MSAVSTGMVTGARGAGKILKSVPPNRTASVLIWMFGALATSGLIEALRNSTYGSTDYSPSITGVIGWFSNLILGGTFMAAIVIQLILTMAQSPIWSKQPVTLVSGTAVVIDTLINAAALYPFLKNLDKTPIWSMLVDAFNYNATYATIVAFIISLFLGAVIAAAPERLWKGG